MHEVAIVETLLQQVADEVRQSGYSGRVTQLDLIVGRLSGASAEAIRLAFEVLSKDDPLVDGAKLVIAEPKAVCRCQACGVDTEIDELIAACPCCQSGQIQIVGGHDLLLDSIDLDDEAT
jgi:hydrogenase nickel incorporation protein HypA/HybF